MNNTLEYRSPESLGIPSDVLYRYLETAQKEKYGLHSIILLRHGKIAMEAYFKPYEKDHTHILYSLSKSFTSTAIGFAVQEGLFSIEDRLIDFFPEKLTNAPCENMKKVKLRHLLAMASGHAEEPPVYGDTDWVKAFLQSYIEYEPGTHFTYNSAGTFMLSAVIQKVTGMSVTEYLRERLFEPLGMSKNIWWEQGPIRVESDASVLDIVSYIGLKQNRQVAEDATAPKIDCGGFGLNVTARDLAKFGQFYLQHGMWDGKQLLSADWIDMATSKQIETAPAEGWGGASNWIQGYGFQFWRCRPEGVYRGDGAFGQVCAVMPNQDAVLIFTSLINDMEHSLSVFWDEVLPAMGDPLPENADAEKKLLDLCSGLQMPVEIKTSAAAIDVNNITYTLSDNPFDWLTLKANFGKTEDILTFSTKAGDFVCTVEHGKFTDNRLPAVIPQGATENRIKAMYLDRSVSGGWVNDTTYRLYLYGTFDSTYQTVELTFGQNTVKLIGTEIGNMKDINFTVYGVSQ